MKPILRTTGLLDAVAPALVLALALALGLAPVLGSPAFAGDEQYSHARIVRLSYVEGTVTVQRPGSDDKSNAPVNTPIQQGFRLSTGAASFAEVEFENGSTARLGEQSIFDFTQLALSESGDTVNQLTLKQGYSTFHVFPAHADLYEVKAGDITLQAQGKTEFRADVDTGRMRAEVFRGEVDYSGASGSGALTRNKVLEISPDSAEVTVSHGIKKDDWDEWVNERDQELAGNNQPPGSYPNAPAYGWSDLNQYGTWSFYPGYGYGWAPQMAGLSLWSPYSFGQWSYYPSFGYTWIGYEPWGWLPYHYGNWFSDPFTGWFWVPGGFNTWSPALVTWYQGPGVIGWTPNTVNPNGGPQGCSAGKHCRIVAVTTEAFRNGKPVNSRNILAMNPSEATKVSTPGIEPSRLAMLPGTPVTGAPHNARLTSGARPVGRADVSAPPVAAARIAPQGQSELQPGSESSGLAPGTWHTRPAPAPSSMSASRSQGAMGSHSFGSFGGESRGMSGAGSAGGSMGSISAGSSHASSGGGSHGSSSSH